MKSSNFDFLEQEWETLSLLGKMAENYLYEDPNACLVKLRVYAETIVTHIHKTEGLPSYDKTLKEKLNRLSENGLIVGEPLQKLDHIRELGNSAAHTPEKFDSTIAENVLQDAFNVGIWFAKHYGNTSFDSPIYQKPNKTSKDNEKNIEQLKKWYDTKFIELENQLRNEITRADESEVTEEKIKRIVEEQVRQKQIEERPVPLKIRAKHSLQQIHKEKRVKIPWKVVLPLTGVLFFLLIINIYTVSANGTFFPHFLDKMVYQSVDGSSLGSSISESSLSKAIDSKDFERITYLIEEGADPNVKSEKGNYALLAAIQAKKEDLINLLLDKNADPNLCNKKGECPLNEAAKINNKSIVNALIKNDADVNLKDDKGNTSIFYALEHENDDVVSLFIKKKVDLDAIINEDDTPLTYSLKKESSKLVDLLVKAGANVNEPDKKGDLPIELAVASGNQTIINKLLLTNQIEQEGISEAVTLALKEKKSSIAEKLLNKLHDINVDSEFLYLAISNRDEKMVTLIIQKGIDLNLNTLNKQGSTPLIEAVKLDELKMAKTILELGADPNFQNKDEKYPIEFSLNENKEMSQLLERYGSKSVMEVMIPSLAGYWINKELETVGQLYIDAVKSEMVLYDREGNKVIKPLRKENNFANMTIVDANTVEFDYVTLTKATQEEYDELAKELITIADQKAQKALKEQKAIEEYEKTKQDYENAEKQKTAELAKKKEPLRKLLGYWQRADTAVYNDPYYDNYKWMKAINSDDESYFRLDLSQVSYQTDYVDIYVRNIILKSNSIYNLERNGSSRFELTFINNDRIRLVLGDILDEYDDYREQEVFTYEFVRVAQSAVPKEFQ